MITTIDSLIYPNFILNNILVAVDGFTANSIIWSTEDLALRKRAEMVEKGTVSSLLPFVSFVRDERISVLPDRNMVEMAEQWWFVGKTGVHKDIKAVRAHWSYSTICHMKKVSDLVTIEKKLLMIMRKPHQLTYEIPGTDMDFGYQFHIDDTDEGGVYYTEDIYETGYLQRLIWTMNVDAWLIVDEGTAPVTISEIDLNLYGYDAFGSEGVEGTDAHIEDQIVIT